MSAPLMLAGETVPDNVVYEVARSIERRAITPEDFALVGQLRHLAPDSARHQEALEAAAAWVTDYLDVRDQGCHVEPLLPQQICASCGAINPSEWEA